VRVKKIMCFMQNKYAITQIQPKKHLSVKSIFKIFAVYFFSDIFKHLKAWW